MSELESLALLIADLSAQVRALQQENAQLREALAENGNPGPVGMPTWDQNGPTGKTTADA